MDILKTRQKRKEPPVPDLDQSRMSMEKKVGIKKGENGSQGLRVDGNVGEEFVRATARFRKHGHGGIHLRR